MFKYLFQTVSCRTLKPLFLQTKNYSKTLKITSTMAGGMPLQNVIKILEKFAPQNFAEKWDNVGLLIEPATSKNINHILLTNDLTEAVVNEALDLQVDLILSYHPPIFSPLKSITTRNWKERIVAICLENRIAVYSPHTSWDNILGGVNDWLANSMPIKDSKPILEGSEQGVGGGRICTLLIPVTIEETVQLVKTRINLQHVRLALATGATLNSEINSLAVCAGSGSSVLKGVDADLYLTGEMLHHDVLDAVHKGRNVILCNHSDSERGFLSEFQLTFAKLLNHEVKVSVSQEDRDPLTTV